MSTISHIPFAKDHRSLLPKHPSKTYGIRGLGDIKQIAVHHSLTLSGSAKAFATYHVNNNKWPGIGYHFVIEKDGTIIWCHDLEVRSYHVGNSNRMAIGICLVGDFRKQDLLDTQLQPLLKLLKYLLRELNLTPADVRGHSEFPDYGWKACPCVDMEQLRDQLVSRPNSQPTQHHAVLASDGSRPVSTLNYLVLSKRNNLIFNAHRAGLFQSPDLLTLNRTLVSRRAGASEPIQLRIKGAPEKIPDHTMRLVKCMRNLGHRVFEADQRPYNLNIVGVRSNIAVPNSFDDELHVLWKFDNVWQHHTFKITTDPGLSPLLRPINAKGTAILKCGQYRGAYAIGHHKGKEALVQRGPVTVIRDDNRDATLDFTAGASHTGYFGINIHRAFDNKVATVVNSWSAGCQVFADPTEFREFMSICKLASAEWGNSFTYTLINECDLASVV